MGVPWISQKSNGGRLDLQRTMASPSRPTKRKTPAKAKTLENIVQEIIVWWLLMPVLVVVIAGFLVNEAVRQLTGLPAATLTQGIVAVPAMLVYLVLRFLNEFGWPPSFLMGSRGGGPNMVNKGSGNQTSHVVKAGFLSRVQVNQTIAASGDGDKTDPPNRK